MTLTADTEHPAPSAHSARFLCTAPYPISARVYMLLQSENRGDVPGPDLRGSQSAQ